MVRGLAFAALMVVVRLVQSTLMNTWPAQAALITIGVLLLGAPWATTWGVIDGRTDARAQPDPDRRADLAMVWLLAGLVAGVVSGAVSWIISRFYKGFYVGGLINELTTFAAFTALIVFVPGLVGVALGRLFVDRKLAKQPVRHHGLAAKEGRDDTDVFTAVRGDESPTGEIPVQRSAAQTEERTAAVATAERDAPTEAVDTREYQGRTQAAPAREHEGHTEAAPTREYGERTEAGPTREYESPTEKIDTGRESPTEVIRLDDDTTRPGRKPRHES